MKQKLKLPSADKMWEFVKQYKFILIIIITGIAILAVPTKKVNRTAEVEINREAAGEFCLEEFESELSKILSQIYGAGEVSVMLTVSSEAERVFATNREYFMDEEGTELREEMVMISTGSGEEVVLLKRNYPTFRGALVVCPGGDDPNVALLITKALSSLTGLSSNRITVCKSS